MPATPTPSGSAVRRSPSGAGRSTGKPAAGGVDSLKASETARRHSTPNSPGQLSTPFPGQHTPPSPGHLTASGGGQRPGSPGPGASQRPASPGPTRATRPVSPGPTRTSRPVSPGPNRTSRPSSPGLSRTSRPVSPAPGQTRAPRASSPAPRASSRPSSPGLNKTWSGTDLTSHREMFTHSARGQVQRASSTRLAAPRSTTPSRPAASTLSRPSSAREPRPTPTLSRTRRMSENTEGDQEPAERGRSRDRTTSEGPAHQQRSHRSSSLGSGVIRKQLGGMTTTSRTRPPEQSRGPSVKVDGQVFIITRDKSGHHTVAGDSPSDVRARGSPRDVSAKDPPRSTTSLKVITGGSNGRPGPMSPGAGSNGTPNTPEPSRRLRVAITPDNVLPNRLEGPRKISRSSSEASDTGTTARERDSQREARLSRTFSQASTASLASQGSDPEEGVSPVTPATPTTPRTPTTPQTPLTPGGSVRPPPFSLDTDFQEYPEPPPEDNEMNAHMEMLFEEYMKIEMGSYTKPPPGEGPQGGDQTARRTERPSRGRETARGTTRATVQGTQRAARPQSPGPTRRAPSPGPGSRAARAQSPAPTRRAQSPATVRRPLTTAPARAASPAPRCRAASPAPRARAASPAPSRTTAPTKAPSTATSRTPASPATTRKTLTTRPSSAGQTRSRPTTPGPAQTTRAPKEGERRTSVSEWESRRAESSAGDGEEAPRGRNSERRESVSSKRRSGLSTVLAQPDMAVADPSPRARPSAVRPSSAAQTRSRSLTRNALLSQVTNSRQREASRSREDMLSGGRQTRQREASRSREDLLDGGPSPRGRQTQTRGRQLPSTPRSQGQQGQTPSHDLSQTQPVMRRPPADGRLTHDRRSRSVTSLVRDRTTDASLQVYDISARAGRPSDLDIRKVYRELMATARKDQPRPGPRTRIPGPQDGRARRESDDDSPTLKRYDSGVDITNISPTDTLPDEDCHVTVWEAGREGLPPGATLSYAMVNSEEQEYY